LFEESEVSLDAVSGFVELFVIADFLDTVRFWRNDWLDAPPFQIIPDIIAVISFISQKSLRLMFRQIDQRFVCFAVRRFATREVELERSASGICESVNFTGEASPRTTKRLFLSPPFAPAA
jgi:hypothetical protein